MWNTVLERWQHAEPGQRKLVVTLTIALLLTAGGSTMLVKSRGAQSTLYTGLAPTETREIAAELAKQGLDFSVSEDETSITVPTRLESRARMRLASAGLPRSSPEKGWEIFGEGGLAVTKPQQQAMQIRALQGELSRSIASLDNVSKAAVHISLKQDSPFLTEQQPAKAAVLLHLKGNGALSPEQAMAIAHLVAKSVPDLETAQVTILDEKGNLLFSDNVAQSNDGGGAKEAERELERRVQSQLDLVFGLGKAIVRAKIETSTERSEVRRTRYEPAAGTRQGIAASESVEQEDYDGNGGARGPAGVPGIGGNLFNETNPGAQGNQGGRYTKSRQETDFKVNEEQEVLIRPGGGVSRMTLGIFVDESLAESLDKIESVARSAAGIDEQRGDRLSIEAVKFAASGVDDLKTVGRNEMLKTIARLILNSLALIIGLLTLKSIIAALKPQEPELDPAMFAAQPQLAGIAGPPMLTGATAGGLSGTAVGGEVRELMSATGDDVIDPHFEPEMTGMTPEEMLTRVESTAVDDVAEVLRHWLEGDLDA